MRIPEFAEFTIFNEVSVPFKKKQQKKPQISKVSNWKIVLYYIFLKCSGKMGIFTQKFDCAQVFFCNKEIRIMLRYFNLH